jgi:hypothetical protein
MTSKLIVTITPEESMALYTLAASEMRRPAEQMRWLMRQELLRRGLLETECQDDIVQQPGQDGMGVDENG